MTLQSWCLLPYPGRGGNSRTNPLVCFPDEAVPHLEKWTALPSCFPDQSTRRREQQCKAPRPRQSLLFPSPSKTRHGGESTSIHSCKRNSLAWENFQVNTWKIFSFKGHVSPRRNWLNVCAPVISTGRMAILPLKVTPVCGPETSIPQQKGS